MNPDDFSQFDDPRVRDVMAAAANLVSAHQRSNDISNRLFALETALFAAQHSKSKEDFSVRPPLVEGWEHYPKSISWPCKGIAAPYDCTSESCRPAQHLPEEAYAHCGCDGIDHAECVKKPRGPYTIVYNTMWNQLKENSQQMAALINQMQRALLDAEDKNVWQCCRGVLVHAQTCTVDLALTATGLPDHASRDAKRKELGI